MSFRYPLMAWGTADDISASPWGNLVGTPTVTGSQTDPFGGTSAYKIDDANAGANEARSRSVGALTSGPVGTGFTGSIIVCVKGDTAAGFRIFLTDTSAGNTTRISLEGTVSGGVPSVTASTGIAVTPAGVALGGSWYAFLATSTALGMVSGNTHRLELYATASGAANTGATIFYSRPMVLLDYLDNAVAYSVPREGSEQVQAPSGVEDAWTIGTDEMLRCMVRAVPADPRASPAIVSGWYGESESSGVNAGVKAMLKAGRDKQVMRFVPDRSSSTTYMDSYLVEPMGDAPTIDTNPGDRAFPLALRGSTVYAGY